MGNVNCEYIIWGKTVVVIKKHIKITLIWAIIESKYVFGRIVQSSWLQQIFSVDNGYSIAVANNRDERWIDIYWYIMKTMIQQCNDTMQKAYNKISFIFLLEKSNVLQVQV